MNNEIVKDWADLVTFAPELETSYQEVLDQVAYDEGADIDDGAADDEK